MTFCVGLERSIRYPFNEKFPVAFEEELRRSTDWDLGSNTHRGSPIVQARQRRKNFKFRTPEERSPRRIGDGEKLEIRNAKSQTNANHQMEGNDPNELPPTGCFEVSSFEI